MNFLKNPNLIFFIFIFFFFFFFFWGGGVFLRGVGGGEVSELFYKESL